MEVTKHRCSKADERSDHLHAATQTPNTSCCVALITQVAALQEELAHTRSRLSQALATRPSGVSRATQTQTTPCLCPESLVSTTLSASRSLLPPNPELLTSPKQHQKPVAETGAVLRIQTVPLTTEPASDRHSIAGAALPQKTQLDVPPRLPEKAHGVSAAHCTKQKLGTATGTSKEECRPTNSEQHPQALTTHTNWGLLADCFMWVMGGQEWEDPILHEKKLRPVTALVQTEGDRQAPVKLLNGKAGNVKMVETALGPVPGTSHAGSSADSDEHDTGIETQLENGAIEKEPGPLRPRTVSNVGAVRCCWQCETGFPTYKELEKHAAINHPGSCAYRCNECDKYFDNRQSLLHHTHKHSSMQFLCRECSKAFSSERHLKNHERLHRIQRRYICSACGKAFTSLNTLTTHEAAVHRQEKPYACPDCGQLFGYRPALRVHQKAVHMRQKPYKCSQCGKSFSTQHYLRQHVWTHTDARPLSCSVCSMRFLWQAALRAHMRRHTGERPYVCRICGKDYSHSGQLQIHIRMHTGERPFACDMCEHRFRCKKNLRAHRKVHAKREAAAAAAVLEFSTATQ